MCIPETSEALKGYKEAIPPQPKMAGLKVGFRVGFARCRTATSPAGTRSNVLRVQTAPPISGSPAHPKALDPKEGATVASPPKGACHWQHRFFGDKLVRIGTLVQPDGQYASAMYVVDTCSPMDGFVLRSGHMQDESR